MNAPVQKPALEALVVTHLVNAIQFGTITIRYQNGKPTHVERNEIIRLAAGSENIPAQ